MTEPRIGPPGSLVEAAVLVGVFRDPAHGIDGGPLRLVLVRRSDGGLHGGQIAFPGGKREPGDASLADTALREAREEIGLPPAGARLLAELPVVQTLTSRFRISPFLAAITPPRSWRLDPREISEVLEVAIDDLLDPAAHGEESRHFPNWPGPRTIPYYRVGEHRLWGATYRIAHPLLRRLAAGEWGI
jgi:8-oxo-dGTP pyrophosphatase MutT (NUDIX family)